MVNVWHVQIHRPPLPDQPYWDVVTKKDYDALAAKVAALESALRKVVTLCGTCDGKGGWGFEDEGLPFQPCPKCAPLRAVISATAETPAQNSGDANG